MKRQPFATIQGLRVGEASPARGVKIIFSEKDGPRKTLYYFSSNVSDYRGKNIALLQFGRSLGQGDSFIKSASYLLHTASFSQVRNFLLDNSSLILQDDTGVPVSQFNAAQWELRPFGRYLGPAFAAFPQPKLSELYQISPPNPIEFGIGYRWRANESNLLLAIRSAGAPEATASVSKVAAPRRPETETAAETRIPVYRAPASRQRDDLEANLRSNVPFDLR